MDEDARTLTSADAPHLFDLTNTPLSTVKRNLDNKSSSSRRTPGKFSFSFTFVPLPTKVTHDHRGLFTVYQSKRAKYYFLKLGATTFGTNHRQFHVYTNDQHMAECQNYYTSTSSFPNKKFIISKMLSCIFLNKKVRVKPQHFSRLRQLFIDKYANTKQRIKPNNHCSNRYTKTFIKFSVKKNTFYFGPYYGCHCHLPAPYVMSNNRFRFAQHINEINKTHYKYATNPALNFIKNKWNNEWNLNKKAVKEIKNL